MGLTLRSLYPSGDSAMDTEVSRATVLIVDDHALVREGVCRILETQDDLRVVGQAATVPPPWPWPPTCSPT